MRTRHQITIATALGTSAAVAVLAASIGAEQSKPPTPDRNDPVEFVRGFYVRVLTGDLASCRVFTVEGRRDFVADMSPAGSCREAVEVLGNSVGPDHLHDVTRTHSYVLMSRDEEKAVVRADFGATADLMNLHWIDGEWRVGLTSPTTTPLVIE